MKSFLDFLKSSKAFLKSPPVEAKNIHFTLGNEACDLDSTVASLALGFFLLERDKDKTVIPILNVHRDKFFLRTENNFVLRQAEIPLEDLIFRNEINFEEILSKHNPITVSLVDHHILSKNDEILETYITQIFDHRPVDSSHIWDSKKVQIRIEPVGSCCTLIADHILKCNENILDKPLAYLLYQTIIYDTIALKPENLKATALDIEIATRLEETFDFTEGRQALFDKLWEAHNDVSSFTPKQLLDKDLKVVGGVYVPGLPVLVEEYLNMEGSLIAVEEFAMEHNITCLLLVGLNASKGTVQRDLAIYSNFSDDKLKKSLINMFECSNSEYDFKFEKRRTKYDEKIHLLHVHNIKMSRKQLVPLVKSAWQNYLCENQK